MGCFVRKCRVNIERRLYHFADGSQCSQASELIDNSYPIAVNGDEVQGTRERRDGGMFNSWRVSYGLGSVNGGRV